MYCTQCGKPLSENARFCGRCGNATRATSSVDEPLGLDVPAHVRTRLKSKMNFDPAGFWLRAGAYLVDYVICSIIVISLFYLMLMLHGKSSTIAEQERDSLAKGMGLLISWLYFTILESSSWRATPGKMLLGIEVVDSTGEQIGFGRANGRFWAKIISVLTFLIGFFMAGFTRNKQALHDMIADTFVIKA